MKKILTFFAAVATAFSLCAEGYQVNSLSAKQNGMGHTGTALKLGAESMFFNPAGMGFMDHKIDFSGSFTAILATATATTSDGNEYKTDNPASTPLNFNLGFSVYDNFKVGVSFYTPYGSNINWTNDWPGALLNQKVKLATYTVQPTAAWRILPNLSVGAGLMITWGKVDLNKGLINPKSLDAMLAQQGVPAERLFGEIVPASVNLNGTADVAFGYNVGVLYDINDKVSVGANFRSSMMMKVGAGMATVSYANELAKQVLEDKVGLINEANFSAEMPCVSVLSVGVSYKPISKLILAADIQYSFWNQYESLDIKFDKLDRFNQHIEKKYINSFTYHLGAQYALTNRLDVRLGVMIDTPPMHKYCYNPETPGMTKIEPSAGLSFRPVKNFSIDFSMLYVAGLGRKNASGSYEDLLLKSAGYPNYVQTFTADYKVHAVCPSIGASVYF